MKRLTFGLLIFIFIVSFFVLRNNIELAMNVTGIIGLGGFLLGGFLKTGFISSTAPVIGNLAIIELDESLNVSNTVLLIALPCLIGSILLYFLK